jgi:hypothetical protein
MDAAVLNTLQAVAQEQDQAAREALMERSNAALGAHFIRNTADLEELAFDLLNVAWSDAMSEDITQRIIEVKTVGLGDPDYLDEDLRGMRAVWQGKGGQIFSDMIRYERRQMPREEMAAAIDLHRDEIALNFWGEFQKLQNQSREKIRQLPIQRLVELIRAGVASGHALYGEFARATITDDQLDSIVDEVIAENGNATIIGNRQATRVLANIGMQFSDDIATQVFRTGQVGIYKGSAVVEVENFEDFAGNKVLPTDELWVVGQKAGRLTYYGAQPKTQQLPRPSFYVRWETARDAGMLLVTDRRRIGRVKLT